MGSRGGDEIGGGDEKIGGECLGGGDGKDG